MKQACHHKYRTKKKLIFSLLPFLASCPCMSCLHKVSHNQLIHAVRKTCCFFSLFLYKDHYPGAKQVIKDAIARIQKISCLRLVQRTSEKYYVRFIMGSG